MERDVHIMVYDMTYRYDLESEWMDRLKKMLEVSGGGSEGEEGSEASIKDTDTMA